MSCLEIDQLKFKELRREIANWMRDTIKIRTIEK